MLSAINDVSWTPRAADLRSNFVEAFSFIIDEKANVLISQSFVPRAYGILQFAYRALFLMTNHRLESAALINNAEESDTLHI